MPIRSANRATAHRGRRHFRGHACPSGVAANRAAAGQACRRQACTRRQAGGGSARDGSRLAAQLHHPEPGTRDRSSSRRSRAGRTRRSWSPSRRRRIRPTARPRRPSRRSARSSSKPTRKCRSSSGWSISPTCGSPSRISRRVPKEQLREIVAEITKAIPEEDRVIALDRVLAFVDKSAIVPKDVPGLKADPPVIFFSNTPAVVVNFDGEPIWSPIAKNDLKFAVNTNWDVFQHEPTKTFYLRYNDSWLTAPAVTGPWTAAGKLPPSFSSLPADENFAEVKKAVPGKSLPANQRPNVNVSMVPAELILLRGAPSLSAGDGDEGSAVGLQYRERRVPPRQDRAGLLPRGRTMVLGARFHRTVDVRDAEAAGRLQEDPARTRALARARVGARHRSGDRSRAPRAGSADGARRSHQDRSAGGQLQRRAGVHGDRRHLAATRASTPTRTSSCSAASTTTAARVSGSPASPPPGRGWSRRPSRPRSTRSPRARRRITSPTWSSKRMTTTTTSGSRSRMPPVTPG